MEEGGEMTLNRDVSREILHTLRSSACIISSHAPTLDNPTGETVLASWSVSKLIQ